MPTNAYEQLAKTLTNDYLMNSEVEKQCFSSPFIDTSIRNPFEQVYMQRLIDILNHPRLNGVTKRAALVEYKSWAKRAFPTSTLTTRFCELLETELKTIPRETNVTELSIYFIFHGTSNPAKVKENIHGTWVMKRLTQNDGINVELAGVVSDPTFAANPQNLLIEILNEYKQQDPFHLQELIPLLKASMPAAFRGHREYVRLGWIKSGEGVFSQALLAFYHMLLLHKYYPLAKLNVYCLGHSRGSVAALLFSHLIQLYLERIDEPLSIEIFQTLHDMVPGGDTTNPNYRTEFFDPAFEFFKKVNFDETKQSMTLMDFLEKRQPDCVRRAIVAYERNETRPLFDEFYARFSAKTEVYFMVLPGAHNDGIFGPWPSNFELFGMNENLLPTGRLQSFADPFRDHVRAHYEVLLSGLIDPQLWQVKKIIENYGIFLVKGYDRFMLPPTYLLLQSSQVRRLSPQLFSVYPELFYDKFHENLFAKFYPNIYEKIQTLYLSLSFQREESTFEEIFEAEFSELHKEFNEIPKHMQYVLLNWMDHKGMRYSEMSGGYDGDDMEEIRERADIMLERKNRVYVDSPATYLASAFFNSIRIFGDMTGRSRKMASRQTTQRRAFLLDRKHAYLCFLKETHILNPSDRATKFYADYVDKKYADEVVFNVDKVMIRIDEIQHLLKEKQNSPIEEMDLQLELELVQILMYYHNKDDKHRMPTPVYMFLYKAPHLLDIYLQSDINQLWYSESLKTSSSLQEQLTVLRLIAFAKKLGGELQETSGKTLASVLMNCSKMKATLLFEQMYEKDSRRAVVSSVMQRFALNK